MRLANPRKVSQWLKGSLYVMSFEQKNEGANVAIKVTQKFTKDAETLKAPPAGSTIYCELFLGPEASPDKQWVDVFSGLKIQWPGPMLVALIIQNPAGKVTVKATNPALKIQVGDKIGLDSFYVTTATGLIHLLFTTKPVEDSYLDGLTSDLERLSALIEKA